MVSILGEECLVELQTLVSNTDSVKPRIPGPYHAQWSLECARDEIISEDEVRCP